MAWMRRRIDFYQLLFIFRVYLCSHQSYIYQLNFPPSSRCYHDALQNKTIDEIRNIYANYTDPHCTPYKANDFNFNFFGANNTDGTCDKWIYEFDHGYQSMSSEVSDIEMWLNNHSFCGIELNINVLKIFLFEQLNWVCESQWKSTIGQSMFFVGSVVGTTIFGTMADSIGRLPVLIFSNVMALIGNGITVFSTNVPMFSISRFISGLAVDSNFLMMYILGNYIQTNWLGKYSNQIRYLIHLSNYSAWISASVNADIWIEFVHWHFLLSRFGGDTMDCRLPFKLEIVYHLYIASDCNRTIFLLHFAGECTMADIEKRYWRSDCLLPTSSTIQWTYHWQWHHWSVPCSLPESRD